MAKQAKASYSAHIQEKWIILYVCLKERIAKCIGSDPSYSTNYGMACEQNGAKLTINLNA